MPPNSRYVGRPGKYGNPFKLVGDMIYCDASHRRIAFDPWVIFDHENLYTPESGRNKIVELHRDWINGVLPKWAYEHYGVVRPPEFTISDIKNELSGLDLACFCSTEHDCHVDYLLKLANSE